MPTSFLGRVSDERCLSLIGMAGAGKSTLGAILARRLGFAHLDTDRLIEATVGQSLPGIMERLGLDDFLRLEEDVVASLSVKRCIVSTGGSVVYGPRAVSRLKSLGPVIFLHIDLKTFLARVGDPRDRALALPRGLGLPELHAERQPLYEKAADLTVSACDMVPEACADEILARVKP